MPFSVKEQSCTDSSGNEGSYVVVRSDSGEQVSCHQTRQQAEQAMAIRRMEAKDVGEKRRGSDSS